MFCRENLPLWLQSQLNLHLICQKSIDCLFFTYIAGAIMLLDALQENNSNYVLAAKKIVVKIITKKFGISNVTVVTAREHSLQDDNSSCGA